MASSRTPQPPSPVLRRLLPAAATALVVLAYAIAGAFALPRYREVVWLGSLPSADAAAPVATPARYSGLLHAPPGRKTPFGTPAAAFWWSVADDDDDSPHLFCNGRERSALSLETSTGTLRVEWTDADPSVVALIGDGNDNEYGRPLAIDVGGRQHVPQGAIPSGTCVGENAKYTETTLDDGARVEIVGCVRDGAIRACDGPLRGVLAAPAIDVDRRHRFEQSLYVFRFAFFAAFGVLLVTAIGLALQVQRAARAVRPGSRA